VVTFLEGFPDPIFVSAGISVNSLSNVAVSVLITTGHSQKNQAATLVKKSGILSTAACSDA
jgi:hypothetical protein